MDYSEQLLELADSRIRLANKYAAERKRYGELKAKLDICLAAKLSAMMEKRKTLGYETAMLSLISGSPELADDYQESITRLNNYKAIERMIDAHDAKTTSIQSIMRYNRESDGGR